MGIMVEIVENDIVQEPEAEPEAGTAQDHDSATETQLTEEISTLWSDHVRLHSSQKATAAQLRQLRARLAERLHAMKTLLPRPGRGGQWRSWLKERGIPRSTADHLVSRHAETLDADNKNCLTESISEPAEADVQRLFHSVWPHLKKKLPTARTAYDFLLWFVGSSGLAHEKQPTGILVLDPGVESPSAASPPTYEPVAGGADTGNGDVA